MSTNKMLGYSKGDLDDMIGAVSEALTTVNFDDDPWLHNNLFKTVEFLNGLWTEGYFD